MGKRKAIALDDDGNGDGGVTVSTKLRLYDDPWKIKKEITDSDLGHLCRLLLPSGSVENHVLPYFALNDRKKVTEGGGMRVVIEDMDTHSIHSLNFNRWGSSKSYLLQSDWRKEFVKRRGLTTDDEVGLFWNKFSNCFCFSVFKKIEPPTKPSLDLSLVEFGGDLTLGLPL